MIPPPPLPPATPPPAPARGDDGYPIAPPYRHLPASGLPPGWVTVPGAVAPGPLTPLPAEPPGRAGRPARATAALWLGIAGLVTFIVVVPSLLAIVFGGIALAEPRRAATRADDTDRRRAIAGLVMGIIGVTAFAAMVTAGALGAFDETTSERRSADTRTSTLALQAGDCVDLGELRSGATDVRSVEVVSCTGPHDAEVFSTGALDHDTGTEYPGTNAVMSDVESRCGDAAPGAFKIGIRLSQLDLAYLYPQERLWDVNPGYVCLAGLSDGTPLTDPITD